MACRGREDGIMWKILLGIWVVSFVLLVFFYVESELRWRSKGRHSKKSEP